LKRADDQTELFVIIIDAGDGDDARGKFAQYLSVVTGRDVGYGGGRFFGSDVHNSFPYVLRWRTVQP